MSIKVKSQNNTWADGKECYNKTSNTYTPIEYIESTGTQYIDTEHSAPNGFVTSMDMMWTELDSDSYNACIGSHNSNEPWRDNYIRIAKAIEYQLGAWGGVVNHTGVTINEKVHIDASTVIGNSYLSVDGISRATSTGTDFRSTNNLYLFTLNSSNTGYGAYNSKMRLYSCKLYDFKNYTTNKLTNTSFENNMTGWAQNGAGTAISAATNEHCHGSKSACIKMTGTVTNSWITQNFTPVYGHKYYYTAKLKTVTKSGASLTYEWKFNTSDGTSALISLPSKLYKNGWNVHSGICDTTTYGNTYVEFVFTFGSWNSTSPLTGSIEAYFDDAMLIDLTETFGAGNEPTKEWCDANIEYGEVKAGIEKTLIRDYIPVLDHNNTPCLFDKVSNKFFYNKGTGNFIAGSAIDSKTTSEKWIKPQSMFARVSDSYTPVDYIESTGTQYLDTGFRATNNTKIEVRFHQNAKTSTSSVIAARKSWLVNGFGIYVNVCEYGGNSFSNNTYSDGYWHTVVNDRGKIYMDNVLKGTISATETSFITPVPLFIFGNNNNGTYTESFIGKIACCKIYESDILVRDFIPVIDKNGVACLYDKVHGQFYYNQGTGDFIAAETSHVEVEYIESTGTQYIDTGVLPSVAGYSSEIDFQLTEVLSGYEQWIFAEYQNGETNWRAGLNRGTFWEGGGFTYSQTANPLARTIATGSNTVVLSYSIYLFAQQESSGVYHLANGKFKLYSCKVWDNNRVLIRNFIPVRDKNNIPCLYDKVEGKYYYNKGTGEFLAPIKTYTELEYIEVNGNQYVNTGYKPNTNTTIEICASTEDMTHDKPLFGTRVAYNNDAIVVWFNPHNKNLTYAFGDTANVNVPITTDYNIPYNVILKNGSFTINGQTHTFTEQAFNLALNLILFGLDTNGSIDSRKFYGRLYYCRIYDNGILVRDYIPVKDRNGIICLYDKVNNKYYYDENGYGLTGGKIAGCNVWKQVI